MTEFTSGFWDVYIAVLAVVSIVACGVFLKSQSVRRPVSRETTGHTWDEDLAEYNNPLPRWWMYLFWITLGFAVVYLAIYPGFGKTNDGRGALHQYENEMAKAEERYAPIFNQYLGKDLKAVAADPEANAMGQRMFLTYCAQCHGAAAQGAKGFPNLTDDEWNWGGDPDTIKTTILGGRMGVMPPFGPALGAEGVKDVANYVRSLSGLAHDSLRAQRGKDVFAQNCVACHGADGKGSTAVGAPNLTNKSWLYGSSEATIIETITNGRTNQMPTFQAFLGEAKVHLLAAYVTSLSNKK